MVTVAVARGSKEPPKKCVRVHRLAYVPSVVVMQVSLLSDLHYHGWERRVPYSGFNFWRPMPTIELDGLEVSVYRSDDDGVLVVDISGPDKDRDLDGGGVPKLRVWLNEGRLYEHPQKKGHEPMKVALIGTFSSGFHAIGPFEDDGEAMSHCGAFYDCTPQWIFSLNMPSTKREYLFK